MAQSAGAPTGEFDQEKSHWSRIILVVDQEHGLTDPIAYNQRKSFLIHVMPKIQKKFGLSRPLSVLFLSTQVYHQIKDINRGSDYKQCCQRVLWQMLQKHNLSGRWGTETEYPQSRASSHTTVNILTEEDDSSSSSDEESFGPQVTNFVDFKEVKTELLLQKKKAAPTKLQRRVTRRVYQKLNCYDDDDAQSMPRRTM